MTVSRNTAPLPTGDALAAGEELLRATEFSRNNLAFWAKVRLAITNRRVAGSDPHLFLGLVPTGSQRRTYPLPSIAGTGVNTHVWIGGLLLAGVFVLLGLGSLAVNPVFGVLVLLLAFGLGLNSFWADITITNTGGQSIGHRIAYYERGAAAEFTQALNTVLTALPTQPANRQESAPVPPPANSIGVEERLAQLASLRERGLITEDEYSATRQEILLRI
jgi:hypothetical protein